MFHAHSKQDVHPHSSFSLRGHIKENNQENTWNQLYIMGNNQWDTQNQHESCSIKWIKKNKIFPYF